MKKWIACSGCMYEGSADWLFTENVNLKRCVLNFSSRFAYAKVRERNAYVPNGEWKESG